jgi:hypothetical protein
MAGQGAAPGRGGALEPAQRGGALRKGGSTVAVVDAKHGSVPVTHWRTNGRFHDRNARGCPSITGLMKRTIAQVGV